MAAAAALALAAAPGAAGELSGRDRWGCELLLCLSSPEGPASVPECRPPLERMRRALRRGESIPGCPEAPGYSVRRGRSAFEPCSTAGLSEPPGGLFALGEIRGGRLELLSEPESLPADEALLSAKPCVGPRLGTVTRTTGNGDSEETEAIGVYSVITRLPRHRGPCLELWQDGRLVRRAWH